MNILIICKRQYTNRDLLDDKYGRLFEIPEELSKIGNEVRGLAISYRKKKEGVYQPKGVIWHSINGYPFINYFKIHKAINDAITNFKPDIVWTGSDALIIPLVTKLCVKRGIPVVADFYDNYESFSLAKFPLITKLLRESCKKMSGITTVTTTLSKFIQHNYKAKSIPIIEIGNAANADFFPMDKKSARSRLGLPENSLLIGTAGALDKSRGIETLFEAFSILKKKIPLFLVVAGPRDNSINKYSKENIIDLGILKPQLIPFFFNSLDVAIICNQNSAFGKYCYPQKYEEIIACQVPFLAADVGELSLKLADSKANIFDSESSIDLSKKIEFFLNAKNYKKNAFKSKTWKEQANSLNNFFLNIKYNLSQNT